MAPRKSKAKKSTETMRQRQLRLLREQRAAKARQNQKALPPGKKGGELAKAGESKPENPRRTRAYAKQAEAAKGTRGGTRVGQPPGSANRMYGANVVGKAVSRAQRAAAVSKAGKIAGRAAVPLGMAAEVKEMSDRAKRDAERNKKLGRRPFEELRADSRTRRSSGSTRRGQNSKRPVANLPSDYKKTEAAASKAAEKPKARQNVTPSKPRVKAQTKPPAGKKPAKPQTSGVGPVASGRSYSVKKTGKSVMQQQADELRAMRKASQERQAADKKKAEASKKKRKYNR